MQWIRYFQDSCLLCAVAQLVFVLVHAAVIDNLVY